MTEKINIKKLIIPLIFEQLLAVSVGMVDTLMVSTVGEVAVSGVALVDNLNRLIIQVMSAFCAGGVVISSQYYGSGNMKKTKKTCAQLDLIMLFASVLSMIVCLLFSRGILNLCFKGVEADVMDCAVTYLVVTSISYPFLASYNSGAAVLRSIGDSKTGMNVSIVMNVINVAFNALFVFGLHMGVLGVGLATLLGRIAAAVIMRIKTESVKNPLKVEDKKDYIPTRRKDGNHVQFNRLSPGEKAERAKADPAYGKIVCRCETVTEGDLLDMLSAPIPAVTVDMMKKRLRAGMGRCQGGFCSPRVAALIAEKTGCGLDRVTKHGGGSWLVTAREEEE